MCKRKAKAKLPRVFARPTFALRVHAPFLPSSSLSSPRFPAFGRFPTFRFSQLNRFSRFTEHFDQRSPFTLHDRIVSIRTELRMRPLIRNNLSKKEKKNSRPSFQRLMSRCRPFIFVILPRRIFDRLGLGQIEKSRRNRTTRLQLGCRRASSSRKIRENLDER